MRPAPWGWSVYTSKHQSLSLNETGIAPSLSRSRTDLFFETPYFQEFCLSRPRNFPQKLTKNHQNFFAGLPSAPPPYEAAPLPPNKVGAKCLAAVVLDNQDRALRLITQDKCKYSKSHVGLHFRKFFQSSKLKVERLFSPKHGKRDVQAWSSELWNSIQKCHPKWDWL